MTREKLNEIFSEKGISLLQEIGQDVYLIKTAESSDIKQVLKVIDINQKAKKDASERIPEEVAKHLLGIIHGNELIWNEMITLTNCEYLVRILQDYIIGSPQDEVFIYAIRMPYYKTLSMLLKEAVLGENEIISLGIDICNALRTLHHNGAEEYYQNEIVKFGTTLHLDIKPDNIFCDDQDGISTFMLGDFGTLIEKGKPPHPMRTDGYYPPEMEDLQCIPTEAADIFSLGMVLYRCICGNEETAYTFWQSRFSECDAQIPENCSPHLWNVILRATKRNPEERYQSAAELQEALNRININKLVVSEVLKEREETGDAVVRLAITLLEAGVLLKSFLDGRKKLSGKMSQLDFQIFGTYEGGVKNGKPHGDGKYTYTYGNETKSIFGTWEWVKRKKMKCDGIKIIYTGMLCNGHICGLGDCKIPKTGNYLGVTHDGKFQIGTMQWDNGDSYAGLWADKDGFDWMHGSGAYCYADGTVKSGQWEYGKFIEKE